MNNSYLKDIIERIELVSKKAAGTIGFLSTQQLNWRDNPQGWSVAMYLHYIMAVNKSYLPTLIQVKNGTRKSKKREKLPILPDLWGSMLKRMLKTEPKGTPKPVDGLHPPTAPFSEDIVSEFLDHQGSLVQLFLDLDKLDHDAIIITSPVRAFVTYPIKDIVKAICLHEERHMKLALGVVENVQFPRLEEKN